jgi:VWFA-related protein
MRGLGRLRLGLVLGCAPILCLHALAQQTKEPERPPFKIEVNVNKVLIPVVVRDAKHHVVGDLRKEDFQVFDKDKPQVISGFTVEKRSAETGTETGDSSALATNSAPHSSIREWGTTPTRFVVFLFDDLHLGPDELGKLQKLGTQMLAVSLTESDMAAVVSLSGTNSGLTRDRAKLEETIGQLKSQFLYRHQDHQCPNIDYYEADLIENKRDGTALEAAVQQTLACANLDPQTWRKMAEDMVKTTAKSTLMTGDQDIRVTLATLREFVKKMGALPGQRTLILISPGFLTLNQEAMMEKAQILDLAAQSKVTISALDARGLYTTGLGASERGPESKLAMQTGYDSQSHGTSMGLNEDVMAELADGSGGNYFHNSNDLLAGVKDLVAAPAYVYVLELSLANLKPDGAYHRLKVKVNRDGLQVQARRGYFAPKPDKVQIAQEKDKLGNEPEIVTLGKEPEKIAPGTAKEPEKDAANVKPDIIRGGPATKLASPEPAAAPTTKESDSKLQNRSLKWTPPQVNTPLRSRISSASCALSDVLERVGARAGDLYASLQSFSAQERIEYEASDHMGYLQDSRTGMFDYVVLFEQTAAGTTVRESRQPMRGSHLLTAFTQDVGLPEMALMFLPEMQGDYELTCEGAAEWNGQPAWVLHFVNRKDKPGRALSFRDRKGRIYPARLGGRAWVAADSGEVIHMELSLTDEIPEAKVRHWYLSINYAPVQFHHHDIHMRLPQTVDAYCDFEDHRTVVYHTFSNFMLFSVQTNSATEDPGNP